MTVAAIAAEALDKAFRRARGVLTVSANATKMIMPRLLIRPGCFQPALILEMVGTEFATKPAERFAGWYMPKLLDTVVFDRTVHLAFIGVINLSEPVTSLFRPQSWHAYCAIGGRRASRIRPK